MQAFSKIIIATFTLYMLLCIPALAAQRVGGFVSNTPMAAGPDASIGEVWMRHGGARLQYDALMGSVQMNTNGKLRRDPAAVNYLPPLYPQKYGKAPKSRVVSKKATSNAKVPAGVKSKGTAVNPSPKPALKDSSENKTTPKHPYSGQAPVAPDAPLSTEITKNPSPTSTATTTTSTAATTTN